MEDTKTTGQTSNYIELSQDSHNVGNIFNELSGELGELNFSDKTVAHEVEKKHPLEIAYTVANIAFILAIVTTIILSIDVFARSSEDNALFTNLPICSYLSYGINDYENENCKTPFMISAEKNKEKEELEKNIITNLVLLVPKSMQTLDITNSPKVQFIQEHTGNSRVPIMEVIDHFLELKNKSGYQGEDIECSKITADEKGNITTSCQVYGGSLIVPVGLTTKTSRETALSFLERLIDPRSGFQVLSYPKTLNISVFNSTDGLKTLFSTQTSLDLKLQYLPANKM